MKTTLLTIILCCILVSVRGHSLDTAILLTKKEALYYYEQKKLADFWRNTAQHRAGQRDSALQVIKEKNIQLNTYAVELDAQKLMLSSMLRLNQVAQGDVSQLNLKVKVFRRQRNKAVVILSLVVVGTAYVLLSQ